jgi:hypothetical protein
MIRKGPSSYRAGNESKAPLHFRAQIRPRHRGREPSGRNSLGSGQLEKGGQENASIQFRDGMGWDGMNGMGDLPFFSSSSACLRQGCATSCIANDTTRTRCE